MAAAPGPTPPTTASQVAKDAGKVKICPGHTRPIVHINYSNIVDGTYWFVTSCHDSKPMIRNGESGDWVGTFEGHKGAVYCSAFDAGASRLVTGSGDYTAVVWDAVTGQNLHTWNHPHYIKSNDWWSDRIVTGNFDGHVRVFDANNFSPEPLITLAVAEKQIIKNVYFVNDTNIVISASESLIKKWDLRSKQVVGQLDITGLNVLDFTHYVGGTKPTLVAGHGKSISFVDPATLQITHSFLTTDDVECASLSPDGRFVAVGSKIKAKEFAFHDGTELENHRGHHGPIFHVRYAPDGTQFATGAEDGMCRVWPAHETILKFQD